MLINNGKFSNVNRVFNVTINVCIMIYYVHMKKKLYYGKISFVPFWV